MWLFKLTLLVFIGLFTFAAFSNASQVSGIYVQKYDGGLLFMQIVITPDGRATGRGEFVMVLSDGKLGDKSFELEGSIDGNQISLKSNVIRGERITFSGTVDGDTLNLITKEGQFNLLRSDLNSFVLEKSKLEASAAAIADANQKAKFEAKSKEYLDKVSSEGRNLEIKISKLSQVESKAENFLKQTRQKRNSIVKQIEILKAKIPFVSAYDGGAMEANIGAMMADMGALRSQFDANIFEWVGVYDELQTSLKSFKSSCDKWVTNYSPTLPPRCNSFQTYFASYQSSRANMRYRFKDAEMMFAFN